MDDTKRFEKGTTKQDAQISWDETTREKFQQLIEKVPIFIRGIAEKNVSQKAESLVKKENRQVVCEKDLVDAFFAETPFGFHGPMKTDMTEIQIDYMKYGYPK